MAEEIPSNIERMQKRIQEMLASESVTSMKSLISGKKLILCGPGRNENCDNACAEMLLNDKCGYHKRIDIRMYLFDKAGVVSYILDDIKSNGNILELEEIAIKTENLDPIIIFPDTHGPAAEFLKFKDDKELKNRIILFVKEEHLRYDKPSVFNDYIREFRFQRGLIVPVRQDSNICETVINALLDYFRNKRVDRFI